MKLSRHEIETEVRAETERERALRIERDAAIADADYHKKQIVANFKRIEGPPCSQEGCKSPAQWMVAAKWYCGRHTRDQAQRALEQRDVAEARLRNESGAARGG